jgi:hypothetical protein
VAELWAFLAGLLAAVHDPNSSAAAAAKTVVAMHVTRRPGIG